MRSERELDCFVAKEVFGNSVKVKEKGMVEVTPQGEKPLRKYSRDIGAAWEVAEKLNITMVPVENEGWFAFVGTGRGWSNPAAFLEFMQQGNFMGSGAAIAKSAAEAICLAAFKSLRKENTQPSETVTYDA